jgi:Terminase-like family.
MSTRNDFAPGLDLAPDDERDHGTDADIRDLAGLSTDAAAAQLSEWSKAERIDALFGFSVFDYQRDLVDYVDTTTVSRAAVKPGRQVGKTVTAAALAAEDAIANRGEDTMIAAPFQETADEMMREAVGFLREAQERLAALDADLSLGVTTENKREWEFSHGGRLLSRTLGVDGVGQRGKSPQFVVVDEAAFVPDDVFQDVLEPFFLTHDEYTYILTSTPSGDAGYFYERVETDGEWRSPYWPSAISPLVDAEWLAEKQQERDRRTFRQEYLGEFIGSSDRFFTPSLVDEATDADTELARDRPLVLGADIARAGDDRTVVVGLDALGTAEVLVSDPDMSLTDAAGRLAQLHDTHDVTAVCVDETGLGAGVVEMLESEVGRRLVDGVKFTLDRKQSLYNRLKNDLENGDVTLAYHGSLMREMKQLRYSLTGRGKTKIEHPDGGHDDHCDALALATRAHRGGGGGPNITGDNVVVL